jgi:hypothetical protein
MTTLIDELMRAKAAADPFGRPHAEQIEEYQRAKAALNEEAKENWDNESWHREMAAVLAQRFDYGFQFDNLFGTYFEVRQVGEFDQLTITERRGLNVFWTARGGYIEETQLKTERFTLPRDTIGFHVSEFADKLRANYAETIEALVGLATQRLDAEVNRRMLNLLQAAIPSTSPYYVNATTGLTKTILDTALREVQDNVQPNNGGVAAPVTILGRAAMIDQISDVVTDAAALFDPEATAEIRRRGRLGVYRGANIVRINNYTDENDNSYIPANELWVFGGTVGTFVKYGGMQTKSWEENTVDYRHYRGRMDCGGLIYRPEQARRIVDGTVTP